MNMIIIDIIRSIIFNAIFYVVFFLFLFFGMAAIPFDKKYVYKFWHYLSHILDLIIQNFAGITYTIEHSERISQDTPAIYAIRHESTWETLVMIQYFYEPIFVVKKELLSIPFFGALSKKIDTIDVNRDNGVRALMDAVKRVEGAISSGHPVVMFPEGTRVPTGEHVEIKRGIALFYKKSNCTVVPIVHDSGKLWARQSFLKRRGKITVKCLEPIPPGLSQDEFMERLNSAFYSGIESLKNIECDENK